jgi:hypothetical protein
MSDLCRGVEDRAGRAITLGVENLFPSFTYAYPYETIVDIFPVGSVLAIKEPYVFLGRTTGVAEIRVSVPSDIERLPLDDPTLWRYDSPVSM